MNKFIKGDKVFTERQGKGVVKSVKDDAPYPILVVFKNGAKKTFTKAGLYLEGDVSPILYHEGTQIIEFVPERNPEIVVDTLLLVWQINKTCGSNRYFSHWANGKVSCFLDGATSLSVGEKGTAIWDNYEVVADE